MLILLTVWASAWAAPIPPRPPQESAPAGLESWSRALEQRVDARRAAAREAWNDLGGAYLAEPGPETADPLVAFAPEIQEPLLAALDAELERPQEERRPESISALLGLLGRTMNPVGGDRLVDRIPRLPEAEGVRALRLAAERGSRVALRTAEEWLAAGGRREAETAMTVLLAQGPVALAPDYLRTRKLSALDPAALAEALSALAARDLPDGFVLPAQLQTESLDARLAPSVLAVLQVAPLEESEDFVTALAVSQRRLPDTRRAALAALEQAAGRFRWRRAPRALEDLIEDRPEDPLAEDVAWTLHRLGEREGARFLLAKPEALVKARPTSPAAREALAYRHLELQQYSEAYREFRVTIGMAEDKPARQRAGEQLAFRPEFWVAAARAAAGARRTRDAEEWLQRSQLSPEELAPYRNAPEFEDLLSRPGFKRLFGLD